jgi:hypothetical protein
VLAPALNAVAFIDVGFGHPTARGPPPLHLQPMDGGFGDDERQRHEGKSCNGSSWLTPSRHCRCIELMAGIKSASEHGRCRSGSSGRRRQNGSFRLLLAQGPARYSIANPLKCRLFLAGDFPSEMISKLCAPFVESSLHFQPEEKGAKKLNFEPTHPPHLVSHGTLSPDR